MMRPDLNECWRTWLLLAATRPLCGPLCRRSVPGWPRLKLWRGNALAHCSLPDRGCCGSAGAAGAACWRRIPGHTRRWGLNTGTLLFPHWERAGPSPPAKARGPLRHRHPQSQWIPDTLSRGIRLHAVRATPALFVCCTSLGTKRCWADVGSAAMAAMVRRRNRASEIGVSIVRVLRSVSWLPRTSPPTLLSSKVVSASTCCTDELQHLLPRLAENQSASERCGSLVPTSVSSRLATG